MPSSPHSMFRNSFEFFNAKRRIEVPLKTRGIYVLYMTSGDKMKESSRDKMKVVYVGMSAGEKTGIRGRLNDHYKAESKVDRWTHFSVFEVWPNVPAQQIEELEGLLRQIYSRDKEAIKLGKQKKHAPLAAIRRKSAKDWI